MDPVASVYAQELAGADRLLHRPAALGPDRRGAVIDRAGSVAKVIGTLITWTFRPASGNPLRIRPLPGIGEGETRCAASPARSCRWSRGERHALKTAPSRRRSDRASNDLESGECHDDV